MMDESRNVELRALALGLGVAFGDATLLDRALTHASVVAESDAALRDYEALEFLGDAVLDLAVAHALYERMPERTPGEYSRLRAGLVNRRVLARIAGALNIAGAIRLGKGEELSGGRKRISLLADCLESLVGAVYLDQGWAVAQDLVRRIFAEELDRELASGRIWDFKSRLQNLCQAEHIGLPEFRVVRSEGPDHRKEFEVEVIVRGQPAGRGRGSSKKEAEQGAARIALEAEGQRIS